LPIFQLGEALQSLGVIYPKNKGQTFADDENHSPSRFLPLIFLSPSYTFLPLGKFNLPDEFVLSDTTALQNLFVHRSRSKLQQTSNMKEVPPIAVLSPRASRAKLTKAETDDIKGKTLIG